MADFASRRTTMVDTQVRPSDVTKYPIIDAMLSVPREDYVPESARDVAYVETNIDLGDGREVLAARSFAKLLEAVSVGRDDSVLDLGCGLGYSTAVLAHIAQFVVAVENDESMAEDAQRNLSEQGVDNAAVVTGSLAAGAAASGPYDRILVQGAIEQWPDALTEQLTEGGHVGAFWAEGSICVARLGIKHGGRMIWRDLFNAGAPRLAEFEKAKTFAF